jgi:hypothetical protein
MKLIPLTLAQWQQERRWEAAERAATVRFVFGGRTALFLHGRFFAYSRDFPGGATHPDSGTQSTTSKKEPHDDER